MAKTRAQIEQNKAAVRRCLTEDTSNWSRACVLKYPEKFERSIDLLVEAARAAAINHVTVAQELIFRMDDMGMRHWFDDIAQNAGTVRLSILGKVAQAKGKKTSLRRPTKKG